jgi:hypothetical protein
MVVGRCLIKNFNSIKKFSRRQALQIPQRVVCLSILWYKQCLPKRRILRC